MVRLPGQTEHYMDMRFGACVADLRTRSRRIRDDVQLNVRVVHIGVVGPIRRARGAWSSLTAFDMLATSQLGRADHRRAQIWPPRLEESS